mmetsp:Transcript_21577/g.67667  ORF Transcript_21577/g.67667 Transcript_21577/m.67667 type:complete len:1591 (+) Transcript_21577:89-4861(+)
MLLPAHSFGRPRGRILHLDHDHCVHARRNGIVLFPIQRPWTCYILPTRNGDTVSTFTTNAATKQLAYASQRASSSIYVLDYPWTEHTCHLTSGRMLEYTCLAFTRCADRILSVTGCGTSRTLDAWCLKERRIVVSVNLQLPIFVQTLGDMLSVNPCNEDVFCFTGQRGIVCGRINKSLRLHVVRTRWIDTTPCNRTLSSQFEEADENNTFDSKSKLLVPSLPRNKNSLRHDSVAAHCWAPESFLLVATHPDRLHKIDVDVWRRTSINLEMPPLVSICDVSAVSNFVYTLLSNAQCLCVSVCGFVLVHIIALDVFHPSQAPPPRFEASLSLSPFHDHIMLALNGLSFSMWVLKNIGRPEEVTVHLKHIVHCHTGPVSKIASLEFQRASLIATAGVDGKLTICCHRGLHFASVIFGGMNECVRERTRGRAQVFETIPITSLCGHRRLPLLAAGLEQGSLMFIAVNMHILPAECSPIEVVGNMHISHHSITVVSFHPKERFLALATAMDSVLNVMTIQESPGRGYISEKIAGACLPLGTNALDLAWVDRHLVVSCSRGLMVCFSTVELEAAVATPPFRLLTMTWMRQLHLGPLTSLCSVLDHVRGSTLYGASTCSSTIVAYDVSESCASPIVAEVHCASEHMSDVLCMAASSNRRWVVTGDGQGTIVVWQSATDNGSTVLRSIGKAYRIHDGPVNALIIVNGNVIISSCLDGSIYSFHLPGNETAADSPSYHMGSGASPAREGLVSSGFRDYHLVLVDKASARLSSDDPFRSKLLREQLAQLQARIQELVLRNDGAPPLEKVARDELIVDTKGCDDLVLSNAERLRDVERKLELEEEERQQALSCLKAACCESMEVPMTQCKGILDLSLSVASFPVRRCSPLDHRIDRCLRTLRDLEVHEMQDLHSAAHGLRPTSCVLSLPANWIVNDGLSRPGMCCSPTVECNAAALPASVPRLTTPMGQEEARYCSHDTPDAAASCSQLYPPVLVTTPFQKRMQLHLVCHLLKDMRERFNAVFNHLQTSKLAVVDRISEKNKRIREISTQLQTDAPLLEPALADCERPLAALGILEAAQVCESQHINLSSSLSISCGFKTGANTANRALENMMRGRFPHACESSVRNSVPMGELDSTARPHTDRVEFTNSEAKMCASEVEEAHRKSLVQELKKLRTEVQEVARAFDEELGKALLHRTSVKKSIALQECYVRRLCVHIIDRESLVEVEHRVECKDARLEVNLVERYLHSAQTLPDGRFLHTNYGSRSSVADTGFETRNTENDALPKSQVGGQKDSMRASSNVCEGIADVPSSTSASLHVPAVVGEGVEHSHESRLDADRPRLSWSVHSAADNRRYVLNETIVQADCSRTRARRSLQRNARNAEFLLQLQQGQDEIDQETVVTDYTDAVLIPTTVVMKENDTIKRLGAEQIKVLIRIKEFRKCINFMEWESVVMKEQVQYLNECYVDLQLLHVTRDLQSVVRGKIDDQLKKTERTMTQIKMFEKVEHEHSANEVRARRVMIRKLKDRRNENVRLKHEIEELKDSLQRRELIMDSSAAHVVKKKQRSSASRFKELAIRRRLVDLVRELFCWPLNCLRLSGAVAN